MRFHREDITRKRIALGIIVLLLISLLVGWYLLGSPLVWKADGTWHIQKRITEEPYTSGTTTMQGWVERQCGDPVQFFIGLRLMPTFGVSTVMENASFGSGYDQPMTVSVFGASDKALLNTLPDKVKCTVYYENYSYTDTIQIDPIVKKHYPISSVNKFTAGTRCSQVNRAKVDITTEAFNEDGTRDVTVSGVMMTDKRKYDYNAELVETGNRTRMLVISSSTNPKGVQPLSGCNRRTTYTTNLSLNLHNVNTLYVYHNGKRVAGEQHLGAEHIALGENDLPPIENMTYWMNGTIQPLDKDDHVMDALHETLVSAVSHIHHVPVQGVYMNCTSSLRQSGVVEVTFHHPVRYKLDANGYPQSATFSLPTSGQPLIFDGCTTPGATDSPVGSTVKWQEELNQQLDTLLGGEQ